MLRSILTAEGGGLAAVSGEAGIGKTRLLEELRDAATTDGHLVVTGRAAEYEQEVPFGLIVDGLDPYLESLDPQRFERLARDGVQELASVFPALRGLTSESAYPVTAAERFRIHRAIRDLLERLAVRQPLLLVLEDVHWADGASIELLIQLISRPPQAAVAVAFSYRHGQIDRAIRAALADRDPGSFVSLALAPLTFEASAALLPEVTGVELERIQHASGGNPFFLLQLAEASGDLAVTGPRGSSPGIPAAVSAAIERELDGLTGPARSLSEVCAVIGDPFDATLAESACDLRDAEFATALDELASRDLIKAGDLPRHFSFRHPLMRTAIYEGAPPGTVMRLHRKVGQLLMARGASAADAARHVERSATLGDSMAVDLLRSAAEDVAAHAPTSAARWFRVALDLHPVTGDDRVRRDLLMGLAQSAAAAGDLDVSHASFVEALDLTPVEDGLHIRLTKRLIEIEQLSGRHEQAKSRFEGELAALGTEPSPATVLLKAAAVANGFFLGQREDMFTWAEQAVQDAESLEQPALTAVAYSARALSATFTARLDEAFKAADTASEVILELPDGDLVGALEAIGMLVTAELYLDRYESCCEHASRGLRIAREAGQGELIAFLHPGLGTSLWITGRLAEAEEVLRNSLEIARTSRDRQAIAWALFNLECAVLARGDVSQALTLGEECLKLTEDFPDGMVYSYAGVVHGQALVMAGANARAIELIEDRAGGIGLPNIAPGAWRALFLDVVVRAYIGLGDLEAAGAIAQLAREQAETVPLPIANAMADCAQANVALASGDANVALVLAEHAIEHASSANARSVVVASRAIVGRALIASGQVDKGGEVLGQAAEEFEAMGADSFRTEIEGELRMAGLRPAKKTRRGSGKTGIESLTGRELEVAQLVHDRHTNKEIATELFVSLKTVESHVRNIFAKLGVSSRVEIARELERQKSP